MPSTLIITDEIELADDLQRLAAAAGVDADLITEPGAARQRWLTAALVLVGSDQAESIAQARLPRRDGVMLVCRGDPGPDSWRWAVECGAEQVVSLPSSEAEVVGRLGDVVESSERPGPVVGVVGGCGGAGASTLAAGLAVTAAGGGTGALLVDLDPYGGGADLTLGIEHTAGARWQDFVATSGRVSSSSIRTLLPSYRGVAVLAANRDRVTDPPPEALRSVIGAFRRCGDLTVADLPRVPTKSSKVVIGQSDLVFLVVPARLSAVVAATVTARTLVDRRGETWLVVRRSRRGGLPTARVQESLQLPVAGELPDDQDLTAALDRGDAPAVNGRGAFAELCRELVDRFVLARVPA